MARERIDDWMQMAKDLARAERELQIEHWVYITFEYREDDRSRVVLHKIDMPRRMLDRWRWLVEWRRAKYVCQYPRKGVQVYYCYYDKRTGCCCIDCGQGSELDGLDERAKLSGASKLYIEDLVDDFCDNYIMPCVKANAVYENKYLLGTSMARPAIAKRLVEIARKEGASAICHGATGKGNDQIRFELGIKALAPDIKIIAPWRMTDVWTMQSREDEIEYCKQHGIDLPFSADSSYSRDRNLWHISHEGLELEDPSQEPNYEHLLVLGVTPEKAPDEGEYVTRCV